MNKDNPVIGELKVGGFRRLTNYFKSHKNRALVISTVLLIIVIVGGGLLWHRYAQNKNNEKIKNLAFTQLQSTVKSDRGSQQNYAAKTALLDFIKSYPKNNNSAQKVYVDNELFAIYYTAADYQNAKVWLEQGQKDSPKGTNVDYLTAADLYVQLHDNANALKYYKLAKQALAGDKTLNASQALELLIDSQIQMLESKQ